MLFLGSLPAQQDSPKCSHLRARFVFHVAICRGARGLGDFHALPAWRLVRRCEVRSPCWPPGPDLTLRPGLVMSVTCIVIPGGKSCTPKQISTPRKPSVGFPNLSEDLSSLFPFLFPLIPGANIITIHGLN